MTPHRWAGSGHSSCPWGLDAPGDGHVDLQLRRWTAGDGNAGVGYACAVRGQLGVLELRHLRQPHDEGLLLHLLQRHSRAAGGHTYKPANNRILSSTLSSATPIAGSFGYDASGNTLFDGNNRYWYDAEGQLCAVQNLRWQGGAIIQYIYDAEGARIGQGTLASAPSSYRDTSPLRGLLQVDLHGF